MLVLVAILMIVGPLAAVLFLIGTPLFFGLMAYDVAARHRTENAQQPVAQPEISLPVARVELERQVA